MGTFCSDRVRKINGYEQPREARLSKHERPKFITPISPCPALPYSHPQEREKRGKTRKKRDKSNTVRWWWWKKERKRWRNKGLKRWLHVSGVSEVAHSLAGKRKSWCFFFFFLSELNVVCLSFSLSWPLEQWQQRARHRLTSTHTQKHTSTHAHTLTLHTLIQILLTHSIVKVYYSILMWFLPFIRATQQPYRSSQAQHVDLSFIKRINTFWICIKTAFEMNLK